LEIILSGLLTLKNKKTDKITKMEKEMIRKYSIWLFINSLRFFSIGTSLDEIILAIGLPFHPGRSIDTLIKKSLSGVFSFGILSRKF
jgi:hypothetical protein